MAAAAKAVSLVLLSVYPAESQTEPTRLPETVITATRIEVAREDVGRVIDSRSAEEIKLQESSSLNESLQTIPGVRSQNLGGPGSPGTTPIEIRGFRSSGTQLLLNGLRLNDPSSISGVAESYFGYLTQNDLRGVEVLKGANGALYGSEGQAGSVNLLTERPTEGLSAELTFRGGSFRTFEEVVKLNGGTERAAVVATVTRIDSRGLNPDGNYENSTVSSLGEFKLTEELSISPIFRMVSAMNDLDSSPTVDPEGRLVTNQPTESNQARAQSYFYGASADYKPDEKFASRLSVYTNRTDRKFFFSFGPGFDFASQFEGSSFNVDFQNSLEVEELNSLILGGLEFEHQTYNTSSGGAEDTGKQDRYAVFLKNRVALFDKLLQIDGGMRVTHVSRVDRTLPTFEVSSVLKVPTLESRLHSSFSQGFRAPSLFELQGKLLDETTGGLTNVGNRGLRAEETLSFDFGITQPFLEDKVLFDVTFFNLASDNTIVFDFLNQTHFNGGGGENQGIETSLTVNPVENWKLRGAYTWLAKADVDGSRLQRRPFNVFALSSAARLGELSWYTELRYRGSADLEFFGVENRFREGGYTVLDTALNYALSENWEIFVRGGNLFDRNYTEMGYRMPGISFLGGIRLRLS
jgi:vitamin B12 transporter